MLDFSDCIKTGISILTSATDMKSGYLTRKERKWFLSEGVSFMENIFTVKTDAQSITNTILYRQVLVKGMN